ncbi:hypothetical protein BG015_000070 [Linnemannia schmuckeri]|uniref:Uncharacterized protein n=1 Tax=Linnemannia schmuckeri TaxID=64567 RepID=A0A9P5RTP7_9FUNG|nr:hypothetical protein BG015_000070 [Linnemannia schmuckeri]
MPTWANAVHILKQLQTLVVLVSLIHRYHHAIKRLGALEHVRFSLDEIYDYDQLIGDKTHTKTTREVHERKEKAMQALTMFVQDYVRLF